MAKKLRDCLLDLLFLDISLSEKHAVCRLHSEQVDRYHRLVALLRVDSISGDLRPATGSCADVNNLHSGPEKLLFIINLYQFEGSSRPKSLKSCLFHIGVVDMSVHPRSLLLLLKWLLISKLVTGR